MRFEQIHIHRYGRLNELRTPEEGLPNLVAIYGPNEGGKSTFFSFLTTLLFGFSPATRDNHPYTPWGGGDAEGRARIRLDDGGSIDVHRRLLSNGWGRLSSSEQTEDIRNLPLPVVSHVPRAVFQQVFALTLAELASLEGESWELIQDRLVGAMGASDLLPARAVAAKFEREAGGLWRPSRRGNQKARVLAGTLAELKGDRRDAAALDRTLRGKIRELRSTESRLREVREERERGKVLEYRLTRLQPVRRKLNRIDDLREEVGDASDLNDLPENPQGRLDELRERYESAEERIKRLDAEMGEPRSQISAFTEQHQRLTENEEQVRRAAERMVALEELRLTADQCAQEVRDIDRRCQVQSQDLFEALWDQIPPDAVAHVPTGELRDRIRKYQSIREQRRIAEESSRRERAMPVPPPSQVRFALGVGAAAVGLVLLFFAFMSQDRTLPMILGATALTMSVVFIAQWWDAQNNIKRFDTEKAEADRLNSRRVWELREDEGKARDRVSELLTELPVHAGLLDVPTLDLPANLERMQELLSDREDRVNVMTDRRWKLIEAEDEIETLHDTLHLPIEGSSPAEAATLQRNLQEALDARERGRAAERELNRIQKEKQQAEVELNEIAAMAHSLARRLIRIGRGDLNHGLSEAARRLDLRERAEQLADELEREYPDIDELAQEIADAEAAGEAWNFDQESLALAAARTEELTEEIENLRGVAETLRTEIQHLSEGETVDQVDSRIEAARRELDDTVRRRDRAWVIAQIVREAERRFREEHQPDILLRAGAYLGQITGGRYERILVDEGEDQAFFLAGPGSSKPVRVGAPLSTGTREQVYLALRLAIVGHLDARGERLPLFMDEAFVNWDSGRRDRAFGLLREISSERQIFFFTCHENMAEEVSENGGQIVTLSEMASRPAGTSSER